MLSFLAATVILAANPADAQEQKKLAPLEETSPMELVIEEDFLEGQESDELVFDDSLLEDLDSETSQIEE